MQEDDTIVEQGAVKIIMDSQSAPLLIGTEGIMWSTYRVQGLSCRTRAPRARVGAAVCSVHKAAFTPVGSYELMA